VRVATLPLLLCCSYTAVAVQLLLLPTSTALILICRLNVGGKLLTNYLKELVSYRHTTLPIFLSSNPLLFPLLLLLFFSSPPL
jgi:hypothetical protein